MHPFSRAILALRVAIPVAILGAGLAAQAQFVNYFHTHGADVSVGGTGQFSTIVTNNATPGTYAIRNTNGQSVATGVYNQQQYTTGSAGVLATLDYHPVPWAGIEFNYGYTHYSERYAYNYNTTAAVQHTSVTTDWHEATAAYQFHPKHIPFQPFMNVGGGAIDFAPGNLSNQWRGAGLVETGFDLPVHYTHLGFRVEGRGLIYRSPNFYQPVISTRSWRVTTEPVLSAFYRF